MHFDRALQFWKSPEEDVQCADMELIWEALDDALHEVLLCNVVLALHHLLHHPRKNNSLQRNIKDNLQQGDTYGRNNLQHKNSCLAYTCCMRRGRTTPWNTKESFCSREFF